MDSIYRAPLDVLLAGFDERNVLSILRRNLLRKLNSFSNYGDVIYDLVLSVRLTFAIVCSTFDGLPNRQPKRTPLMATTMLSSFIKLSCETYVTITRRSWQIVSEFMGGLWAIMWHSVVPTAKGFGGVSACVTSYGFVIQT